MRERWLIGLVLLVVLLVGLGHAAERGDPVLHTGPDELDVPSLKIGGVLVSTLAQFTGYAPVRAATTTNLTLSGPQTVDGVSVGVTVPPTRVLVKNQTTASANGIYLVATGAWPRAVDMDTSAELAPFPIWVVEGATHGEQFWQLSSLGALTLGTSDLTFVVGTPDCNTLGGPICSDEDTGEIPATAMAYPGSFTSTPPVCTAGKEWRYDLAVTGKYRLAVCVGGAGENALVEPYVSTLDQVCVDGTDCETCPAGQDCTLNIITGTDISATASRTGNAIEVTINSTGGGAASLTRSIWIPASAMEASGTCTSSDPATVTLVTNGPKRATIIPADDSTCSIEFDWGFTTADAWNAGTIQVQLYAFSTTNQSTQVLELDFAGQCVRDGDDVVAHATTGEQAASVTFGNQAADEQISAASSAITLQGTCNAVAHVYMRGQVDPTPTTVSTIANVHILGVKVIYTIQ